MTLYQVNVFPYERQLVVIFDEGTFLARRWEEEDSMNLYHVAGPQGGFFVEVGVDYGQEEPVVLRSFVSSVPLEDYAHYVRLPELGT